MEDARNRGKWIDEFWTYQNVDEIKVYNYDCFFLL